MVRSEFNLVTNVAIFAFTSSISLWIVLSMSWKWDFKLKLYVFVIIAGPIEDSNVLQFSEISRERNVWFFREKLLANQVLIILYEFIRVCWIQMNWVVCSSFQLPPWAIWIERQFVFENFYKLLWHAHNVLEFAYLYTGILSPKIKTRDKKQYRKLGYTVVAITWNKALISLWVQ